MDIQRTVKKKRNGLLSDLEVTPGVVYEYVEHSNIGPEDVWYGIIIFREGNEVYYLWEHRPDSMKDYGVTGKVIRGELTLSKIWKPL